MPPVGVAEHLVDYLMEVGPTTGENELSWTEISNWMERTGVELDEFQAVALVAMSREYLGMMQEARDAECLPPWRREKTEAQKAAAAARVREALQTSNEVKRK